MRDFGQPEQIANVWSAEIKYDSEGAIPKQPLWPKMTLKKTPGVCLKQQKASPGCSAPIPEGAHLVTLPRTAAPQRRGAAV